MRESRTQQFLFTLLVLTLVGLLGWLAERHARHYDWTAAAVHTLDEVSLQVLGQLPGAIAVSAYTRPGSRGAHQAEALVDRYRRQREDIAFRVINPDLVPDELRRRGIRGDGEMVVEYDGRSERVGEVTEQALTNALLRLVRANRRSVQFLAGHGERNPVGRANHDLGQFVAELVRQGFTVGRTNPLLNDGIPADTDLLVIASLQSDLLPGEAAAIDAFLARGGSLLWFTDPDSRWHGLEFLAARLGLDFLPGHVVDTGSVRYGIADPSFLVISAYPTGAPTEGFADVTLLPGSLALVLDGASPWKGRPLLTSSPASWNERGAEDGRPTLDPLRGERRGPHPLAATWERRVQRTGGWQRVTVIGDGDFLANAYLGNGGNLALGVRLVNWLVDDEALVRIPPYVAIDRNLELTRSESLWIGVGFLLLLPATALILGFTTWWRRRRQ